jgi:hypothetical protein
MLSAAFSKWVGALSVAKFASAEFDAKLNASRQAIQRGRYTYIGLRCFLVESSPEAG